MGDVAWPQDTLACLREEDVDVVVGIDLDGPTAVPTSCRKLPWLGERLTFPAA